MMRRVCLTILLAALTLSTVADAAAWRTFHSKQFGFAFQYPGSWKLTVSNLSTNRQVAVNSQSGMSYSLVAAIVAARPGRSLGQTMQRFASFESSTGNVQFARLRWSHTTLGGKPAMVGLVRPSTEGGVALTNAVLVTQWRTHIYEIILTAYNKPAPSQLRQFPSVYGQILRSWRFV